MAESVFILGAGASKHAGAPVMNEFIDTAEDLLNVRENETDYSVIFDFLATMQSLYAKSNLDLNNIEVIFGMLEMALVFRRLYNYNETQIKTLRKYLISLITNTIEKSVKFAVTSPGGNRKFIRSTRDYDALSIYCKKNHLGKTAIISFNYDIALEVAFANRDIQFNYCLDESGNGLNYLKLHGSINWYKKKRAKRIFTLPIDRYLNILNAKITLQSLDEISLELQRDRQLLKEIYDVEIKDIEETPLLVPPTWNKSDYHTILTNIWQRAATELSTAKNIFIIGYSLPESDSFFTYLYSLGTLSDTRIRRIWVYNPDNEDSIRHRYRELVGNGILQRYEFKNMKFDEAIRDISNI